MFKKFISLKCGIRLPIQTDGPCNGSEVEGVSALRECSMRKDT